MAKFRPVRVAALLLACACAAPAAAQETLVTDRPDVTESAVAVPPGRVQVEGGVTFAREDDVEATTVGEVLVRIGVLPRLEARVEAPSYVAADGDAWADPGVGLKLVLREGAAAGGEGMDAAFLAGSSIPAGGEAGAEDWEPAALLLASWPLAGGRAFAANVGWARSGGEDELVWSGSLALPAGERNGVFAEAFGVGDRTWVDAGATRVYGRDFQLDVRAGAGVAGGAGGDWFVGVGAARRF